MRIHKSRAIAVAVTSLALLSFNSMAHADSTDELLKKLRDKGILSQDEYDNFNANRDVEKLAASKESASYKSKIKIGDYIDSITPEGDIRVRYEIREAYGQGPNTASATANAYEKLGRARYAWHLGLKTDSDNDFFSEIRFASNANARSPNQDFNTSVTTNSGANGTMGKQGGALIDRLFIGWHTTDWLTLKAGRMPNPFYTTSLVWDPDLTPEGLAEEFKTTYQGVDLFAVVGEFSLRTKYDRKTFTDPNTGAVLAGSSNVATSKLFPVQVGAHYKFNDDTSAKVAPVYYSYAGSGGNGIFSPGVGANPPTVATLTTATCNTGNYGNGIAGGCNDTGTNNLRILEIPAEVNWKMAGLSWKVWGDYAHNFDGDKRALAAATITGNAAQNQSSQDTAVMLGVQFGSPQSLGVWEKTGTYLGNTTGLKKHDWIARAWYQRVEAYSLDPNLIDSDVMNAQVNMQGVAASGSYMLADNAFVTLSGAHGTRIDSNLGTGGSVDTTLINPDRRYNLLQMDVSWRF